MPGDQSNNKDLWTLIDTELEKIDSRADLRHNDILALVQDYTDLITLRNVVERVSELAGVVFRLVKEIEQSTQSIYEIRETKADSNQVRENKLITEDTDNSEGNFPKHELLLGIEPDLLSATHESVELYFIDQVIDEIYLGSDQNISLNKLVEFWFEKFSYAEIILINLEPEIDEHHKRIQDLMDDLENNH